MTGLRVFVFLQMPQSSFPRLLGRRLRAMGHQVHKINFCGGDFLHWPWPGACNYRQDLNTWPAFFNEFLEQTRATDLLLIGDRRPWHQPAIGLARRRGVRVFVFDEGYVRPNFVTLEKNGVGGRSGLPRDPGLIRELAAGLPPVSPPPDLKPDIRCKVRGAVKHHFGNVVFWPLFPRYRTHRPQTVFRELTGLWPRHLTREKRRKNDEAALREFLADGRPYFFLPLQLPADTQLRCYGRFVDLQEMMAEVLDSFQRRAPGEYSLVIRSHPLDWQIKSHGKFALSLARAVGLEDRVCFVNEGDTNRMIAGSKGLVLVNSTTGLTALALGKPVFCLGEAIYALPGLAVAGGAEALDEFWGRPPQPDAALCRAFLSLLKDRAVTTGNYYTREGQALALEGCLRLLGAKEP